MRNAFRWFDGFDIRVPGISIKFKRPSKSYGTIAKEPSKVNNSTAFKPLGLK